MTDINPGQGTIIVDGVPFSLTPGQGSTDIITATSQKLIIQGSPLVVTFDPPIPVANFEGTGVPQIEAALQNAGHGGGAQPQDGSGPPPTPPTGKPPQQ